MRGPEVRRSGLGRPELRGPELRGPELRGPELRGRLLTAARSALLTTTPAAARHAATTVAAATLATAMLAAAMLAAAMLAAAMLFPLPAAAIDDGDGRPIVPTGVEIQLEAVATVPDNSFGTAPRLNMMASLGDRLFVVEERDGVIFELIDEGNGPDAAGNNERRPEVFFDVGAAIDAATDRQLDRSNVFHGGLRSVAFHPDFAVNGRLYVSAMETRPSDPAQHHYLSDSVTPIAADSVLIEFTYDHDSGTVDPLTYREVFRVGMPVYDHPIKQIAFDPGAAAEERGLLYVAHGDGSVHSITVGGGQNNDGLGKILRIDPLASDGAGYSIPADNPFVSDPTMLDEVYSLGHRNPHHLAFADHPGGGGRILIVAEPGRDNAEEINVVQPGGDYGWPQREGSFVHLAGGGRGTGVDPLPADDAGNGFIYPATEYGHSGAIGSSTTGEAVAGGYVVDNGSPLSGLYLFADFPISGDVFHSAVSDLASAITRMAPGQPPSVLTQAPIGLVGIAFDHDDDPTTDRVARTDLRDVFDDAAGYETTRADVRFGQGPGGELYVMSKRNNTIYLVTNSVGVEQPDSRPGARYVDDQVLRLYQAALGRAPDSGGLRFWAERLQAGTPLEAIADQFLGSPEFNDRFGADPTPEQLVDLLYRNVLGRPGEPGGTEFWIGRLRAGVTRASVVVSFADSDENVGLTGTVAPITSAQSKVLRLYRAALGREPDGEGLDFWTQRLESGERLEALAASFRRSPEFEDRFGGLLADDDYIGLVYRNVLGRNPDPSGADFWLERLQSDGNRDRLLVEFSESQENLERTNTIP